VLRSNAYAVSAEKPFDPGGLLLRHPAGDAKQSLEQAVRLKPDFDGAEHARKALRTTG